MNDLDFRNGFKTIRPSLVGIGRRNDPEHQIIGTGFIVDETGWIMTNKHVLEPLLIKKNGKIGVRNDSAVYFFIEKEAPEGYVAMGGMICVNIKQITFLPEIEDEIDFKDIKEIKGMVPRQVLPIKKPDIGLCKIEPSECPEHIFPLIPVKIRNNDNLVIGTPIGILGFPLGVYFPSFFNDRSSFQLTPLLQTGVISGIMPFSSVPNPEQFILDILITQGSSGSPLFLSDGKVIGIVFASKQKFSHLISIDKDGQFKKSNNRGVHVPTSLGLAVPSSQLPEKWISKE